MVSVVNEIKHSIEVKEKLLKNCVNDITKVAEIIKIALYENHKVVFFGNGGSAADAQHFAGELVGKLRTSRKALRAVALTTDTSILTAIGNDMGFDKIFSRQVEAIVDELDVVVAISTSGNSRNVLNGIAEARRLGATTVALTGMNADYMAEICDYSIKVPSTDTQRIQECHILIGHIICGIVEEGL